MRVPVRARPGEAIVVRVSTGVSCTVVVTPPKPSPSLVADGFASGSCFPAPGIAVRLKPVQEALEDNPEAHLGLFGHADPTGSNGDNKALSENRYRAVLALLTSDVDALNELASAGDWGTDYYQAILRGLGFVPGAIDGKEGAMTRAAIEAFAEASADGYIKTAVPEGSTCFDDAVKKALLEEYVAEYGLGVSEGRLLNPRTAGCSEFNNLGRTDSRQRAASLTIFDDPEQQPTAGEFPCAESNPGACPLDAEDGLRCSFFRQWSALESSAPSDDAMFFDFAWQRTPSGKLHVSALTTAADCDSVAFELRFCGEGLSYPPPSSDVGEQEPSSERLATAVGLVRSGICYALFDYDEFDLFDVQAWFARAQNEEEREGVPVPTFRIQLGSSWCYSTPPGRPVGRIALEGDGDGQTLLLLANGQFASLSDPSGLLEDHVTDPTQHIVAIYAHGRALSPIVREQE